VSDRLAVGFKSLTEHSAVCYSPSDDGDYRALVFLSPMVVWKALGLLETAVADILSLRSLR
jgi:hypothetical protein